MTKPVHPPDMAALMSGLDLKIEHRSLEALVPYAKNARTHSDEQVALIAGSIRSFGFVNAITGSRWNGYVFFGLKRQGGRG